VPVFVAVECKVTGSAGVFFDLLRPPYRHRCCQRGQPTSGRRAYADETANPIPRCIRFAKYAFLLGRSCHRGRTAMANVWQAQKDSSGTDCRGGARVAHITQSFEAARQGGGATSGDGLLWVGSHPEGGRATWRASKGECSGRNDRDTCLRRQRVDFKRQPIELSRRRRGDGFIFMASTHAMSLSPSPTLHLLPRGGRGQTAPHFGHGSWISGTSVLSEGPSGAGPIAPCETACLLSRQIA